MALFPHSGSFSTPRGFPISPRRHCGRISPLVASRTRLYSCRSPPLLDWGIVWISSPCCVVSQIPCPHEIIRQSPPPPLLVILVLSDYDSSQWGQPFEHRSRVWRRSAFSPYVYSSPGPKSVSTLIRFRTYVDTVWNTIFMPINRLVECLPLVLVIHYFDRYPSSFDTNQFFHGIWLSEHSFNTWVGGQARLTCARCRQKR